MSRCAWCGGDPSRTFGSADICAGCYQVEVARILTARAQRGAPPPEPLREALGCWDDGEMTARLRAPAPVVQWPDGAGGMVDVDMGEDCWEVGCSECPAVWYGDRWTVDCPWCVARAVDRAKADDSLPMWGRRIPGFLVCSECGEMIRERVDAVAGQVHGVVSRRRWRCNGWMRDATRSDVLRTKARSDR